MLPERQTAAGISYRESGKNDLPALVLLHGIGSTSAGWRLQYGPLGEHFHVVAWDAPGYADSKPLAAESPSAEAYAHALARMLEALHIQKAFIGTNSWGTPTGVAFARLFPERVRALILGGPTAGWGALPKDEREKRLHDRIERVRTMGVAKMRAEDAQQLVPPGTRAEVVEWIKSNDGVTAEGYAQAARMMAAVDVPSEAALVNCPIRVVVGEKDTRTPPAANAQRIVAAAPQATLTVLPNCGHLPHLEFPEIWNAAVLEMLKEASAPA